MDEERRRTRPLPSEMNRRSVFMGAIGVSALGAAAPADGAIPRVGAARTPVIWVHGNSASIMSAHDLELDAMEGNARVVRGRSWSTIPLHYAIPHGAMALESGAPARVGAIWVRLQAEAGASVSAVALHDCEATLARIDGMALRRERWADLRIPLDPPREVARSIGVTVECAFADTARQISISAIGCEFLLSA